MSTSPSRPTGTRSICTAPATTRSAFAYPAMPGILFGRNRHVAWGVTNNICSLRDLYVEAAQPGRSRPIPARWRLGTARRADRRDRGQGRGGPSPHDALRPWPPARRSPAAGGGLATPPLAGLPAPADRPLAGLGRFRAERRDAVSARPRPRAETVAAAREAYRDLALPDLQHGLRRRCRARSVTSASAPSLCAAARTVAIAAPASRPTPGRARSPSTVSPALHNPDRGWVASANNPTAPPDFPYPLAGTWAPEDRAPRAEHLLATRQPHTLDSFAAMQTDVHSGRAERGTPGLLRGTRRAPTDPLVLAARRAAALLGFPIDDRFSAAAAIFYVFFWRWHQRVVARAIRAGPGAAGPGQRLGAHQRPLARGC